VPLLLIEFQHLTVTAKMDIMKVEAVARPVIVLVLLHVVELQPTVVLVPVLLIDHHTLTVYVLQLPMIMVLPAFNVFIPV
jgi:hypothetical protein